MMLYTILAHFPNGQHHVRRHIEDIPTDNIVINILNNVYNSSELQKYKD